MKRRQGASRKGHISPERVAGGRSGRGRGIKNQKVRKGGRRGRCGSAAVHKNGEGSEGGSGEAEPRGGGKGTKNTNSGGRRRRGAPKKELSTWGGGRGGIYGEHKIRGEGATESIRPTGGEAELNIRKKAGGGASGKGLNNGSERAEREKKRVEKVENLQTTVGERGEYSREDSTVVYPRRGAVA